MYIEIDDDIYNGFDDDLKAKLKEYKPEDVTGIKNKANDLLSEVKELKAELASKDAEVKKLNLRPPESKAGEIQSLLDDAMSKLAEKDKAIEAMQSKIALEKVNGEAMRLASQLTKDTAKASLLAKEVSQRLKYEGDSIVVLTTDGRPTVSKPDELVSEIKDAYPFLVDGRQATGGSATGSGGGAAETKTVSRADFDSMSQVQRSDFSIKGGKVVD